MAGRVVAGRDSGRVSGLVAAFVSGFVPGRFAGRDSFTFTGLAAPVAGTACLKSAADLTGRAVAAYAGRP